jgi:anti-sigma factor RsiW
MLMTTPTGESCDAWDVMIHGLVDDELDPAHSLQLEQHVSQCSRCSAEIRKVRDLKRTISQEGVHWPMPDHVRSQILDALSAQSKKGTPAAWRGWLDWTVQWSFIPSMAALAASLFLVMAVPQQEASLQQELVASHVRSLLADHLTDVPSSDRHTVKPWFNGKIDFSPPVVDLASEGFPLVGGRLDYVSGKVVAALVYRRSGHILNLFISTGALPERATTLEGYTVMQWTAGGLRYAVVSDIGTKELATFRDLFNGEAQK